MKLLAGLSLFAVTVFFLSVDAHAQTYAGLIDNTRASAGTGGLGTNGWATAGVEGGIPSTTWTQCGSTVAAGFTSSVVQTQINGCSPNTCVILAAGTTTLTGGLHIFKNGVCVRGDPNGGTVFKVPLGTPGAGCQINLVLCVQSNSALDLTTAPHVDWTAGFAQGSNVITVSSVTGITSGMMILLDQCGSGLSGNPCVTSSSQGPDNGNFFNCDFLITSPWLPGTTYSSAAGAPLARVTYAATGHWYTVTNPKSNPPPVGTVPTNTTYWTDQGVYATPTFGCAVNGPDGGNIRVGRSQAEMFLITSVNSGTNQITLDGTLRHPNWSIANTPEAVPFSVVKNSGFENITVDMTNASPGVGAFGSFDAANVWFHNIETIKSSYAGIYIYLSVHTTVDNSYCYGTSRGPGADAYCIVQTATSDNLIQNNIAQYLEGLYLGEGSDTGTVFGYNFNINNYDGNNNGINESFFPHSRDDYELYEGNIIGWYFGENFHGPKMMNTLFRNAIWGWESGANLPTPVVKNSGTIPIHNVANSRYHNIIGNVLGNPDYHTGYESGGNLGIFSFGGGNTASSGTVIPADSDVLASTMLWGNYDVVSGAVRWCGNSSDTGWSTTCASASEIPTGFSPYSQPLPTVGDVGVGQLTLPASLYLPSKPSWFGSLPFPLIGPDVSGGNVGICSGTLNTTGEYVGVAATTNTQCTGTSLTTPAWGGHVNTNPAMNCYLNVMGGPPDGSNTAALTFNPAACYGAPAVNSSALAHGFSKTATVNFNAPSQGFGIRVAIFNNATSTVSSIKDCAGSSACTSTVDPTFSPANQCATTNGQTFCEYFVCQSSLSAGANSLTTVMSVDFQQLYVEVDVLTSLAQSGCLDQRRYVGFTTGADPSISTTGNIAQRNELVMSTLGDTVAPTVGSGYRQTVLSGGFLGEYSDTPPTVGVPATATYHAASGNWKGVISTWK
jgi:hypothetical protein